jgi:ribosomal protein S1
MTTPDFDFTIFQNSGKYNTSVKLTEEDKKNRVKILCKEPYAQELYDMMVQYEKTGGISPSSKDLSGGQVYKVKANVISYQNKAIYAEEVNSGVTLCIPFKDYSNDPDLLKDDESSREFYVMLTKTSKNGEYTASEKKAKSITYRQELFDHIKNNTWFDVKIVRLIKGGYLALYKKEVECFIPGSHAAANVVHNFNDLLNTTLTVMVDNYDASNNLFILSYKKYVTQSMPTLISEIKFDHEYDGVLTNKPYDFGVFVEIDRYYTGLIHSSEFEDYEKARKTMKTGDTIKVFVKDVIVKKDQYRIVLTLNKNQVNSEKLEWQELRNRTENRSFKYNVTNNRNSISIDIDGENFEVTLRRKDLDKNLSKYPLIKVFKVDPINKRLNFEFVETIS